MTSHPPDPAQSDLAGRTAMVVGAEFPAGAEIARAYAAAGADVAVCALTADEAVMRARRVKRDIQGMGRRCTEYVMDVTLGRNVQVTTRQVAKEMGGLDLVAAAPELFFAAPIEKTSDMELARVMQVNFAAQFFLLRTAAEEFRREARRGRILLVTHVSGDRVGAVAYAAAQGAVHHLVRAAARELVGDGISVNAIALAAGEGGRLPQALGPTAVRLAGEVEPTVLTGQVITLDGGPASDA